jgi:hypothetical protein
VARPGPGQARPGSGQGQGQARPGSYRTTRPLTVPTLQSMHRPHQTSGPIETEPDSVPNLEIYGIKIFFPLILSAILSTYIDISIFYLFRPLYRLSFLDVQDLYNFAVVGQIMVPCTGSILVLNYTRKNKLLYYTIESDLKILMFWAKLVPCNGFNPNLLRCACAKTSYCTKQ